MLDHLGREHQIEAGVGQRHATSLLHVADNAGKTVLPEFLDSDGGNVDPHHRVAPGGEMARVETGAAADVQDAQRLARRDEPAGEYLA